MTATQTADSKGDTTFFGTWPVGSQASATATLDGTTYQGKVITLTSNNNTINLFTVTVTAVPEFGTIAGASALLLGAMAFIFIRRRRLVAAR